MEINLCGTDECDGIYSEMGKKSLIFPRHDRCSEMVGNFVDTDRASISVFGPGQENLILAS